MTQLSESLWQELESIVHTNFQKKPERGAISITENYDDGSSDTFSVSISDKSFSFALDQRHPETKQVFEPFGFFDNTKPDLVLKNDLTVISQRDNRLLFYCLSIKRHTAPMS